MRMTMQPSDVVAEIRFEPSDVTVRLLVSGLTAGFRLPHVLDATLVPASCPIGIHVPTNEPGPAAAGALDGLHADVVGATRRTSAVRARGQRIRLM
jgi:hypothetical protein